MKSVGWAGLPAAGHPSRSAAAASCPVLRNPAPPYVLFIQPSRHPADLSSKKKKVKTSLYCSFSHSPVQPALLSSTDRGQFLLKHPRASAFGRTWWQQVLTKNKPIMAAGALYESSGQRADRQKQKAKNLEATYVKRRGTSGPVPVPVPPLLSVAGQTSRSPDRAENNSRQGKPPAAAQAETGIANQQNCRKDQDVLARQTK